MVPGITSSCPEDLFLAYLPHPPKVFLPTDNYGFSGSMIIYDTPQSELPKLPIDLTKRTKNEAVRNISEQVTSLQTEKLSSMERNLTFLALKICDLTEKTQNEFDEKVRRTLAKMTEFLSRIETTDRSFKLFSANKIQSTSIKEQTQHRVSKDLNKYEKIQKNISDINSTIEQRIQSLNNLMNRQNAFFTLLEIIAGGKEINRWHRLSSTYDQEFGFGFEMTQIEKTLKKHIPPVISNASDLSEASSIEGNSLTKSNEKTPFIDSMINELTFMKYSINILNKASQLSKYPALYQADFNDQVTVFNRIVEFTDKAFGPDQVGLDMSKYHTLQTLKKEVEKLLESHQLTNDEPCQLSLTNNNPLAERFKNFLIDSFNLNLTVSEMSSKWSTLSDKEKADLHAFYKSSFEELQLEQKELIDLIQSERKVFSSEFIPTYSHYIQNLQANLTEIQKTKKKIETILNQQKAWNLVPVLS